MAKVKIVTNAVCDLSPAEAEHFGIGLIPEAIQFGTETFLTTTDLTPQLLYKKMRAADKLPTGSHANVSMYMDAFLSAGGGAYTDVVCINMTSRMSGSYNTAFIAKNMLEEEGFPVRIHIVDSLQLTYGLTFLTLEAVKLADAGGTAEEIIAHVEAVKGKIGEYFVMRSLTNAKKGGRIGAIRALTADALGVKPVLMFRDGMVSDVAIARNFPQALERLVKYYESRAVRGKRAVVFHADNLADAQSVKNALSALDPEAEISIRWLGSGIGIYTGEGCVGITFWE
ncbi:MAG: DegV family protein [Clostridium sp.]|nr:DegV family protein [Clostridium sp.]